MIKWDKKGNIIKYKTRLVAQGFTQEFVIDYSDTFVPVVQMDTIQAVLATVVIFNLEMCQFDIKSTVMDHNYELQGTKELSKITNYIIINNWVLELAQDEQ